MEVWIPYGEVETLLTIQAENLAELIDPRPEGDAEALAKQALERIKGTDRVVVCDYKPPTVKLLKRVLGQGGEGSFTFASTYAREIEARIPEVKGKVARLSPASERLATEPDIDVAVPTELIDQSKKLFLATAEPDPLVGVLDARTAACVSTLGNAWGYAYKKRESDAPSPLEENSAYAALAQLTEKLPNASFLTIVPKGGEPHTLLEGGGVREARSSFASAAVTQVRAVIAAPGGRGYDETLSHSLRSVWNVAGALRKSGEILLVAECAQGLGSPALEMYATGRMQSGKKEKQRYVQGLEEIAYLERLKEDFGITLLSSLPNLYASTKLGFKSAKGSGEALARVFGAVGKGAKMHVVTRMCELSLSRA